MPRKYKRRDGAKARVISWTEQELEAAFDEMDKKEKGVNEISRYFKIPSRTLRRRYAQKNKLKLTLGKHPVLGFENEKRLVKHILKLGEAGFPPTRQNIRKLAYQFAEKLKIKHNFDHENQLAGSDWFKSFIERNPELSIRQAEGLSVARAKGLNREEVNNFFELLTQDMAENDLLDKPERLYNMDESGVQLNNKPGKVVAKKGAKVVNSVTAAEKGETMTVVACCNAIGNFLPPVLIIKGVNKKAEFENGLPAGSKVYMNRKSAYINTELFYRWLTEHFIPLKPQGKVLLILDGHSSHCSAVDMLQTAADNDIILMCLPSHTTSVLQPLDRSVFGPLKAYFNHETNHFMRTNPNKKISRYNAGTLIRNAWVRAATPANAQAGFRGGGIYPLNPNALPDTTFVISDIALGIEGAQQNLPQSSSSLSRPQLPSSAGGTQSELPRASTSAGGTQSELPRASSSAGGTQSELPRASSSADGTQSELPRASTSAGGTQSELPRASSSAGGTQSELPRASSSAGGTQSELPRASSSAGGTQSELPRASSSAGGTQSELPRASSSARGTQSELPRASSSAGGTQLELPRASSSAGGTQSELPRASSSADGTQSELPRASSSAGGTQSELPRTSSSADGTQSEVPRASSSASGTQSELPRASSSAGGTQSELPQTGSSIDASEPPHMSFSREAQPQLPQTSFSSDAQLQLPQTSNSMCTLFDTSIMIDPDMLKDIDIADIGDDTLAILENIERGSPLEKETPSKILIEASPIPTIPITFSKRAKKSADILNSDKKIEDKRNNADKKNNLIKIKQEKKNKTKCTKNNVKNTKVKEDKKKGKKVVKGKQKNIYNQSVSEDDEDDAFDLSEKENDLFLKVTEGRSSRKRPKVYSSNSDNEDESASRNYYKKKGKQTKGLPVKKTKRNKNESDKNSEEETVCIECFDSYQNTKSKSDWIQCISCQKWLHEICTMFRNYCVRCGKFKTLL